MKVWENWNLHFSFLVLWAFVVGMIWVFPKSLLLTRYIFYDIMIDKAEPAVFFKMGQDYPILDVRSPAEFAEGHIPGACNLPLFDDDERKVIGTLYKQAGRDASILTGLDFVGTKMSGFLKQAWKIAPYRKLRIHCWRGGMRSEGMAWLLSLAGFEVHLLVGGYKAYRRFIREELSSDVPYLVLSGGTGSGKTEILKNLAKNGCQVLDLEGIARHKGSAFGAIGQEDQPTNEQFENDLYEKWKTFDTQEPVWVEDESRAIGRVSIPEPLFLRLRKSKVIVLDMPLELRIHRLVAEYACFPKEELIAGIQRILKNLGGDNAKKAILAIENDDFVTAIGIVLFYYDKTYRFGLDTRGSEQLSFLKTDSSDAEFNTLKILEFCKNNKLI